MIEKSGEDAATIAASSEKIRLCGIYPKAGSLSSENHKDQIGLLLWFLCSPITKNQVVAGYRLLEILLTARYERGQI